MEHPLYRKRNAAFGERIGGNTMLSQGRQRHDTMSRNQASYAAHKNIHKLIIAQKDRIVK